MANPFYSLLTSINARWDQARGKIPSDLKKKKYDAIYALYAFFHKILTEVEKNNNNALYMPRGRLSIYWTNITASQRTFYNTKAATQNRK